MIKAIFFDLDGTLLDSNDKSEIAVFGDDVNDIEMLSEYDNSVAMGYAEDHVKSVARMITKDNDDNGIEFALKGVLKII